jgi:hypothetical protein
MVQLGDEVKDRVTGFKGIATGLFRYLNGCVRVMVESRKLDSAGKTVDATFDEERLDVVTAKVIATSATLAAERAGGPRETPLRHTPSR